MWVFSLADALWTNLVWKYYFVKHNLVYLFFIASMAVSCGNHHMRQFVQYRLSSLKVVCKEMKEYDAGIGQEEGDVLPPSFYFTWFHATPYAYQFFLLLHK